MTILGLLTGCSDSSDPASGPAAASTITEPAPWSATTNEAFTGSPPAFPELLHDGWRLRQEWNIITRAFNDSWAAGAGPEHAPFPATMNGCDTSRFLVRWRTVNPDSKLLSGWISGEVADAVQPAESGWMSLDGCQTPQWQLLSPAGNFLTDVTVDIQEWKPAP
ncbi:MAG: hypothetical protein ABIR39_10695 [Nocardioides sp.]|uniref:hypothetical protein n=1 Tax=Nocardioides sp. TaxID=35761 RepID=UPI003265DCE1